MDDSFAPGGDGRFDDNAGASPWGNYGDSSWGAGTPSASSQPDPYGTAPTPFAGTSPYGEANQQPSYGQPGPAPYGASGPSVPSANMAAAPYGGGYQGPGGPGGPGGMPPYYGAPKKSNTKAILIIVGALALVGLIVGILIMVLSGNDDPPPGPPTPGPSPTTPGTNTPSPSPSPGGEEGEYGSDPELDAYYDACAAGDMEACDDLWLYSDYDTGYWEFGATCGGVESDTWNSGDCEIRHLQGYGDDPALDALWDACAEGDWQACDDMRYQVPWDSEYYQFSASCGGTESEDNYTDCVAIHVFGYGDDEELDQLYDWCKEGDLGSCDLLYREAAYGTDYRHFGETCGGTRAGGSGYCDDDGNDEYGEDRVLDAMWDACAGGDTWQCHVLTVEAPYGSDYYEWGDTCGDTVRSGDCWSAGDGTYGSEPNLDALWDECAAGDFDSCDTLYRYSPWDTEYEDFGSTCGDTAAPGYGWCEGP